VPFWNSGFQTLVALEAFVYKRVFMAVAERISAQRILFPWILSPQKDLLFYIGSALAGWLYVAIIFFAILTVQNPLKDPLSVIHLGEFQIPLTLQLLVLLSWGLILDAPHVWATLARTLFDPDEWRVRKREIAISFSWFFFGPVAILLPYFLGGVTARFGVVLPATVLSFGALAYFVFFRLWAYYHVVRQHWGFFTLYKRKGDDHASVVNRVDWWFFNLSLYMPLVMFMTGPFYLKTPGYVNIGLMTPIVGEWSVATLAYPAAWVLYLGVIVFYLGFQLKLWAEGSQLNGSKLLYMALIVPLHLVAYSNPVMAVFLVPLVTVGHNIQYHCIVYSYAQNKYPFKSEREFRWARGLFKNFWIYASVGLVFTLALYRGPWIDFLKHFTGWRLDKSLLNSLAMMAGVADPASLSLGEKVFAACITGFAMQHYYLDAKIWRVSRDKEVQKYLKV
jgi:hypothetical protein